MLEYNAVEDVTESIGSYVMKLGKSYNRRKVYVEAAAAASQTGLLPTSEGGALPTTELHPCDCIVRDLVSVSMTHIESKSNSLHAYVPGTPRALTMGAIDSCCQASKILAVGGETALISVANRSG